MTFVFPILLGGLLLAGIPILLHLIMKQQPKRLSFPAFRFLVRRQRTNQRKLQLRHLLLLALRVLLIVLLCLALGRPRLFNQGLNLNSERPVAAVLVFDTSMSMEYQTSDKQTRLDEAKKRGQEFLNELPAGSRVVILDTADAVGSHRGDWLVSMSQARERIKALKTRPTSVSALQTLEYAYRILADSARSKEDETSRHFPRFVCVLSDRTRASWKIGKLKAAQNAAYQVPPSLEGLGQARAGITPLISLLKELRGKIPPAASRDYPEQSLIDSLEKLAPLLPTLSKADFPPDEKLCSLTENIQRQGRELLDLLPAEYPKQGPDSFRSKLTKNLQEVLGSVIGAQGLFIDVGIDQPVDLAITDVELPALANGQPRQIFDPDEKFVLRAIVAATGKDLNTTATWNLDQKTFTQAATIKAGERQTIPFEIDAHELKLHPGPYQVEVRLEPSDLLPFNNRRFLTFAIREPRRVLVLTEDPGKAQKFVDTLQLHAQKLGFEVDMRTPRDLPGINPLAYRVVYLFEVPAPEKSVWHFLETFVRQGIGLGIIPGRQELNKESYNNEDAQKIMPARLETIGTKGMDNGKELGAIWNLDDQTLFQHPFMAPFRAWKEYNVVKNPSEAFSFWQAKPNGKETLEVVSYKDPKFPAILDRRINQNKGRAGKVLLFTTPLDDQLPRWNDYLETKNAMFVVLVGLATNYLAGESEEPKFNFIAGQDEPNLSLPPGNRFPTYSLKGPDLLVPITTADKGSVLKFPQAETTGNYMLIGVNDGGENKQVISAFSVNVPADESDLTRVPLPEIESLFGPDAVIPVDRQANIREVLKGHWNEPVELFPLLMVALLLILALENLLANKFYRSHNETKEK